MNIHLTPNGDHTEVFKLVQAQYYILKKDGIQSVSFSVDGVPDQALDHIAPKGIHQQALATYRAMGSPSQGIRILTLNEKTVPVIFVLSIGPVHCSLEHMPGHPVVKSLKRAVTRSCRRISERLAARPRPGDHAAPV